MTLKETINCDLKNAMRARNKITVDTLRMLLAAVQQVEIKTRANSNLNHSNSNNEKEQLGPIVASSELSDQQIIEIINKLIKQRRESYDIYKQAQRTELAENEAREIEVLQAYQPKQLSEAELTAVIHQLLEAHPAANIKDFGTLFGQLKQQFAGRADWAVVSQKLKQALQAN